ncbi:hypothetical protein LP421_15440 [Rhizobium sp. RCAM05350]|nr:hypothetical protein LP421_15440 [Rhizobium sp. RCAM05350]
MSGGNPETLSYLANHDIEGNFDTRVVDALSHYLAGKGGLMVENLAKAIPEYRNSRVGPYLYLVLGNATAQQSPARSLQYYDWARLTAPGTNIEEAALQALDRAGDPRRHAGQGVLLLAFLCQAVPDVSLCQPVCRRLRRTGGRHMARRRKPRSRRFLASWTSHGSEVYLRIARRAAIGGMQELASLRLVACPGSFGCRRCRPEGLGKSLFRSRRHSFQGHSRSGQGDQCHSRSGAIA